MLEWICNRCESVRSAELDELTPMDDDNDLSEEDAELWCDECGDFQLFTAL